MAVTVEALELNVKSSAESAAQTIERLLGSLKALKRELGTDFSVKFGNDISKSSENAVKSIKAEFAKGMASVTKSMMSGVAEVTKKQINEMAKSLQKSYGIRGRDLSVKTIADNLGSIFKGVDPKKSGFQAFNKDSIESIRSLSGMLVAHGHPSTGGDLIDIMKEHMPQIKLTQNDLAELKYAGMSVKDARTMLAPMGISVSKKSGMRIEDALSVMNGAHGIDSTSALLRSMLGSDTQNVGIMEVMDKLRSAWDARNQSMVSQMEGGSGLTASQVAARSIADQVLEIMKTVETEVTNARSAIKQEASAATKTFNPKGTVLKEFRSYDKKTFKPDMYGPKPPEVKEAVSEAETAIVGAAVKAIKEHVASTGPNPGTAEYKALGSDYSRTYNATHPEYVAWAKQQQMENRAKREYMRRFEAEKQRLIGEHKFAGSYDEAGKFTPYEYRQTTATASPGVKEVKQEAKDAKAPVAGLTGELKNLDKELKQKPGDSKKAAGGLNLFKNAVKLVKNAVKNNSSAMRDHAKSHHGLLSQFARVAKMRAMRYVIRSITAGLKEGINNLYQYSKAMKGSFAKSMDTAASTMLTLKNSIATALAPVIEALVPVLQKVVGWVREGCNWLAQFFALMRGQSTWTKAVDYATEYAAATKSANDNTKEMLASFDELNVIASESGSGSNKVQTNPKKMFTEETTFDQSIIPWAEKAKDILGWIKQTAKEIWDIVWPAVKSLAPVVKDAIDALLPIIKDAVAVLTPIIEKAIKWVVQAIKDLWPIIKPLLGWVKDNLEWILPTVLAIKVGLGLWKIGAGLLGGLSSVKSTLGGILDAATALSAIGIITIGIAIKKIIDGSEETQAAMDHSAVVSDNAKKDKKSASDLMTFGGFASLLAGIKTGSGILGNLGGLSIANGIVGQATGINPIDMILNVSKQILDGKSSPFGVGADNPYFKYAYSVLGTGSKVGDEPAYTTIEQETEATLNATKKLGEGIDLLQDKANSLDLSVPGHEIVKFGEKIDTLSGKTIDAPEVDTKKFTKSLSQMQEIALIAGDKTDDILDHWDLIAPYVNDDNYCNSIIAMTTLSKTTGTDIVDIMNNWKLVAPYIDEKNLQKSTMDIIKLSKNTGVDVNTIMAQWKFVAPTIEKYGYDVSMNGIKSLAVATGTSTEYIISRWEYIAPGIDQSDFATSVSALMVFSQTSGIDMNKIIRDWELIAPYIDSKNPRESAIEIANLILKSGDNWKEELKKTKLEAPDVTTSSNFWTNVTSGIKKSVSASQETLNKSPLNISSKVTSPAMSVVKGVVSGIQTVFNQNKPKVDVDLSYAQKKIDNWNPFANIEKKAKTLFDFFPDLSSNKTSTSTSTGGFTRTVYREYVDESSDPDGFIWTDDWDDEVRKMILGYAGGGFPQSGNLFLAHENGAPEYVGQFGSHTAVANNEQIVRGIAGGVEQAMRGVEERLARIEQYAGITAGKDPTVKITPSAALGRVNAQSAALYGQITGR